MEVVGEFLGIDTEKGLYEHFRRYYAEWFPALKGVHRTTFLCQAANLWAVKEMLEDAKGFMLWATGTTAVCRACRAARGGGAEFAGPLQVQEKGRKALATLALVQKRRRIETVISQMTARYRAKWVWARDRWHLTSRFLRKVF